MALFKKNKDNKQTDTQSETTQEKSTKEMYQDGAQSSKKDKNDSVNVHSQAYKVLVKPVITEKASDLGTQDKYIFVVNNQANKIEVSKAVYQVYGVKPKKVNLINYEGKRITRGRMEGKRKDWKKAIVTLPQGKSINIYEGV